MKILIVFSLFLLLVFPCTSMADDYPLEFQIGYELTSGTQNLIYTFDEHRFYEYQAHGWYLGLYTHLSDNIATNLKFSYFYTGHDDDILTLCASLIFCWETIGTTDYRFVTVDWDIFREIGRHRIGMGIYTIANIELAVNDGRNDIYFTQKYPNVIGASMSYEYHTKWWKDTFYYGIRFDEHRNSTFYLGAEI